jgi:GxxExxY protein
MKFEQNVEDDLTGLIIACIIKVHRTLGPGFMEIIYKRALIIELRSRGLRVTVEKRVNIYYEGILIGRHDLDIVVNDEVIIELKVARALNAFHYAQLRSYLKAAKLNVGILVNFANEHADYRRISLFQK